MIRWNRIRTNRLSGTPRTITPYIMNIYESTCLLITSQVAVQTIGPFEQIRQSAVFLNGIIHHSSCRTFGKDDG